MTSTLKLKLFLQADTYFEEVTGGDGGSKWVPRSVQVDLETGVADRVRAPYLVVRYRRLIVRRYVQDRLVASSVPILG